MEKALSEFQEAPLSFHFDVRVTGLLRSIDCFNVAVHNYFMRLAPILAVVLLTTAASAQPPEPNKPIPQTPAQELNHDIIQFVGALNDDKPYFPAARYVANVKLGYYGGPEWGDAWVKQRGTSRLNVESTTVVSLQDSDAQVKVYYRWYAALFHSEVLSETLTLHRTAPSPRGRGFWQIVVPAGKDEPKNGPQSPDQSTPILLYAATQIFSPQPDPATFLSRQAISNLKRLGLGVIMLVQDYDGVYAFYPQYSEEAVLPYMRDATLWNVPGKTTKFSFNGNLSTHRLIEVMEAARTVLIYEGEDEKPVYRYNGKAAICFADGHVALVTPEQVADLIWKP